MQAFVLVFFLLVFFHNNAAVKRITGHLKHASYVQTIYIFHLTTMYKGRVITKQTLSQLFQNYCRRQF